MYLVRLEIVRLQYPTVRSFVRVASRTTVPNACRNDTSPEAS